MGANWNLLIKDHFKNKNKLKLNRLIEMVSEQVEKMSLIKEANLSPIEDCDVSDLLPTVKITENWGKPGTKDKELITEFANKIEGATLEDKLSNLKQIITGTAETQPSIGEILATLMMIEILNSILVEFTEAAGGFLFEGFLAGLFGVAGEQITDAMQQATDDDGEIEKGKPITDVVLGDKQYSLKLLGGATKVKGSFQNMVKHFEKYPEVIYLDARRTGAGLIFGEFHITLSNFLDVFVTPYVRQVAKRERETFDTAQGIKEKLAELIEAGNAVKRFETTLMTKAWRQETGLEGGLYPADPTQRIFTFSPTRGEETLQEVKKLNQKGMSALVNKVINMPDEELQKYAPFTILYTEQKFEGTMAAKLFGHFSLVQELESTIAKNDNKRTIELLRKSPGFVNEEQFVFSRDQVEQKIKGFRVIAELPISPDVLKDAWLNYGGLLNDTLRPVYCTLNVFTKNINSYFLGTETKDEKGTIMDRKKYGELAADNAVQLQIATDKAVQAVDVHEPEFENPFE